MIFTALHSSSSGNLYRLDTDHGEALLIECGVPLGKLKRSVGYRLSQFCGCLVSHVHRDHAKAAIDLMRLGVPVYCSQDTADTLGVPPWFSALHVFEAMKPFKVGHLTIMPFPLVHDVENFGFLISDGRGEKLLYAIDTGYIHYRFSGLTQIAIEANWSHESLDPNLDPSIKQRLLLNHMSLATTKNFLIAQDLRRVHSIFLLHLSDGNSNETHFKREIERATGVPVFVAPK